VINKHGVDLSKAIKAFNDFNNACGRRIKYKDQHTPATLSSAAEYIVKPHKQIADVAIAKMMSETTK